MGDDDSQKMLWQVLNEHKTLLLTLNSKNWQIINYTKMQNSSIKDIHKHSESMQVMKGGVCIAENTIRKV